MEEALRNDMVDVCEYCGSKDLWEPLLCCDWMKDRIDNEVYNRDLIHTDTEFWYIYKHSNKDKTHVILEVCWVIAQFPYKENHYISFINKVSWQKIWLDILNFSFKKQQRLVNVLVKYYKKIKLEEELNCMKKRSNKKVVAITSCIDLDSYAWVLNHALDTGKFPSSLPNKITTPGLLTKSQVKEKAIIKFEIRKINLQDNHKGVIDFKYEGRLYNVMFQFTLYNKDISETNKYPWKIITRLRIIKISYVSGNRQRSGIYWLDLFIKEQIKKNI